MPSPINLILLALMAYFILMNVTVERCYCKMTMGECAAEKWLLAVETHAFLYKVQSTIPRASRIFACRNVLVGIRLRMGLRAHRDCRLLDMWSRLKVPLAIFIGARSTRLRTITSWSFSAARRRRRSCLTLEWKAHTSSQSASSSISW